MIGGVVSLKTPGNNRRHVPIGNDPQRINVQRGANKNYTRSPSAASGLQIKQAETIGPGAGPGPLRKRNINKDPQSRVVGAPSQPGARLNVNPSQGGNNPTSMPSDDLPYSSQHSSQYYSDASGTGPSPVSPQSNNYQDEPVGNQWVNQNQSRITSAMKPSGQSGHNYRGQSQGQASSQQQQRRNVVTMGVDQLNQQPSSHRTLSSNSSQGDDANWNSPQMQSDLSNKEPMRRDQGQGQFQSQFQSDQYNTNSVQSPANQGGQGGRPDSRGQFNQYQSKLDDISPRPSPLDSRSSPAMANQSRNNSSDMINSPYTTSTNVQKSNQFQSQQPSPVGSYDTFSPQGQVQQRNKSVVNLSQIGGVTMRGQNVARVQAPNQSGDPKVQSMNRTFANQSQNRNRNLTNPTNKPVSISGSGQVGPVLGHVRGVMPNQRRPVNNPPSAEQKWDTAIPTDPIPSNRYPPSSTQSQSNVPSSAGITQRLNQQGNRPPPMTTSSGNHHNRQGSLDGANSTRIISGSQSGLPNHAVSSAGSGQGHQGGGSSGYDSMSGQGGHYDSMKDHPISPLPLNRPNRQTVGGVAGPTGAAQSLPPSMPPATSVHQRPAHSNSVIHNSVIQTSSTTSSSNQGQGQYPSAGQNSFGNVKSSSTSVIAPVSQQQRQPVRTSAVHTPSKADPKIALSQGQGQGGPMHQRKSSNDRSTHQNKMQSSHNQNPVSEADPFFSFIDDNFPLDPNFGSAIAPPLDPPPIPAVSQPMPPSSNVPKTTHLSAVQPGPQHQPQPQHQQHHQQHHPQHHQPSHQQQQPSHQQQPPHQQQHHQQHPQQPNQAMTSVATAKVSNNTTSASIQNSKKNSELPNWFCDNMMSDPIMQKPDNRQPVLTSKPLPHQPSQHQPTSVQGQGHQGQHQNQRQERQGETMGQPTIDLVSYPIKSEPDLHHVKQPQQQPQQRSQNSIFSSGPMGVVSGPSPMNSRTTVSSNAGQKGQGQGPMSSVISANSSIIPVPKQAVHTITSAPPLHHHLGPHQPLHHPSQQQPSIPPHHPSMTHQPQKVATNQPYHPTPPPMSKTVPSAIRQQPAPKSVMDVAPPPQLTKHIIPSTITQPVPSQSRPQPIPVPRQPHPQQPVPTTQSQMAPSQVHHPPVPAATVLPPNMTVAPNTVVKPTSALSASLDQPGPPNLIPGPGGLPTDGPAMQQMLLHYMQGNMGNNQSSMTPELLQMLKLGFPTGPNKHPFAPPVPTMNMGRNENYGMMQQHKQQPSPQSNIPKDYPADLLSNKPGSNKPIPTLLDPSLLKQPMPVLTPSTEPTRQPSGLLDALVGVIAKTSDEKQKTKTEADRKNDAIEQVKNDKIQQALAARLREAEKVTAQKAKAEAIQAQKTAQLGLAQKQANEKAAALQKAAEKEAAQKLLAEKAAKKLAAEKLVAAQKMATEKAAVLKLATEKANALKMAEKASAALKTAAAIKSAATQKTASDLLAQTNLKRTEKSTPPPIEQGAKDDNTPIVDLLKSTGAYNWKKKFYQSKPDASQLQKSGKAATISPDKSKSLPTITKIKDTIVKDTTSTITTNHPLPPTVTKSPLAQKLPTDKDPSLTPLTLISNNDQLGPKKDKKDDRRRRKEEERDLRRKRHKRPKSAIEGQALPPDPGYIPKVRITTFRNLSGGTLHSSNQFKPGEERTTRTRSTRRNRTEWESKTVDLSEFTTWEKSHGDRKRRRRRNHMGLPSDEETYQQEQVRRQNEDKRRQEQLEKEPVKLEDETAPDVSVLLGL